MLDRLSMDLDTHPLVEVARDWMAENAESPRRAEVARELERLAVVPELSLRRLCEILEDEGGEVLVAAPAAAGDEQAANEDYRSVLEEVASIIHSAPSASEAVALLRDAHIVLLGGVGPATVELARKETRQIRQILGAMLRQARACGDLDEARAIRARLFSLGVREVARTAI